MTPLTKRDYLLYNQMVTRIRALEHVATQRFFNATSDGRATIARKLTKKVKTVQKNLFPILDDDLSALSATNPEYVAGHGCTFPYCPSGGVCELCGGYEDIQNELLDEHS